MKNLMAFLALMVVGCWAQAESCQTSSRGYEFIASTASSAISRCQSHPSTSNAECDRNVMCGGIIDGGVGPIIDVGPPPLSQDEQCYLDRNPDICRNSPNNYCLNPSKHFRERGQSEGRPWGCHAIQTAGSCYLQRYPDICANSPNNFCRDPEAHYSKYGRGEGRIWGCQ